MGQDISVNIFGQSQILEWNPPRKNHVDEHEYFLIWRIDENVTRFINIDVDDKQDIIEIEIDYAPDVRFCGSLLAYAADSCETSSGSNYSGDPARWTELRLYKTNNGKLICHRTNCTQWANEKDQYSGKVCENTDEVVGFFGYSRIAKELYAEANIASAFEVN